MSRLTDLQFMVGKNEKIIWQGKPKFSCFILESIFNPMLFFALVWGGIDFFLIGVGSKQMLGEGEKGIFLVLILFFCIHLAPVWIYLIGVIFSVRKYQNTEYIVTDKGIYISGGVFSYSYEMKSFMEMSHVNIHRGILDQLLGVGDVVIVCDHATMNAGGNSATFYGTGSNGSQGHRNFAICDIGDYQQVFTMVKDLQADIYADTMYPNDLRPEANHGYRTQYMGYGSAMSSMRSNNMRNNGMGSNDFSNNDLRSNDFSNNDIGNNDFRNGDMGSNGFRNNDLSNNDMGSNDFRNNDMR